jgi:7-cyano-7-deazaguanine synthase
MTANLHQQKSHKGAVLLSGGIDSATAAYYAAQQCERGLVAVTVAYGQKHREEEIQAAMEIGRKLGVVDHLLVSIPEAVFSGASSALIDDVEMPDDTYEDLKQAHGPSPTVVPFRNANLISVATSVAVTEGCDRVYVGVHATDHGAWAYPDCCPEFIGAMANAVYVGTYAAVRLQFPLIWNTKTEVVGWAVGLGVPIQDTYSCYKGGPKHCGLCPTCRERIHAFKSNKWIDPVPYEVEISWEDCVAIEQLPLFSDAA